MSAIKALVISVETAKARRVMQRHQLKERGIIGDIIDAVTPKDISDDELAKLSFSWARPLIPGELACALSHRKAWIHAAQQNEPTLVLEDDVLLSEDIADVLRVLSQGPDLGYISLEYYDQAKLLTKPEPLKNLGYGVSRMYRDRGGAAAYVVWPKTAAKILKAQNGKTPLADAAINLTPNIRLHQLEPACAVQANVMARKHPEFADHDVTKMVAPSARPPYPSKLHYLKCKLRRLHCSLLLTVRKIKAFGRTTNRHIAYTVTPDMLARSKDFGL